MSGVPGLDDHLDNYGDGGFLAGAWLLNHLTTIRALTQN